MFSARRISSLAKSSSRYIFVFLFLLFFFSVTIGTSFWYLGKELRSHCIEDVDRRLVKYIQDRQEGFLMTSRPTGLGGLSFVRLVRENEQLFFTDHPQLDVDFHRMINFNHNDSAVWVSIKEKKRPGDWVIASRNLKDGTILQGGAEYPEIVRLYRGVKNITSAMLIAAVLASAWLTWLVRLKSTSSLQEAENSLQRVIRDRKWDLLAEERNDELAHLYHLLNELIAQNRQLIKEMQESLDNVAHDLRTPMTRLRSVAEYGLQKKDPEKLAEALSDCLEESERVLSMLGIMMSVAEAESGTMHLNKELISLAATIDDVTALYEYVAEEKSIAVNVDIDRSCMVEVDKTRIMQVWANILDNAIKYGKKEGAVKIYSLPGENVVSVVFEDNGIGISTSEIERIWDRLFRGDRSRTEQGLGLGLNYVRAVVEAHGGRAVVKSELGKGSAFMVELPAVR